MDISCRNIPEDLSVIIVEGITDHGLEHWHIEDAWRNRWICQKHKRQPPEFTDYVAIGFDNDGRLIDLIARLKPSGVYIYHADSPPENAILKDLGLIR